MLKAKDIMTKDVITVSPDMEITHVTKTLLKNHINGVTTWACHNPSKYNRP